MIGGSDNYLQMMIYLRKKKHEERKILVAEISLLNDLIYRYEQNQPPPKQTRRPNELRRIVFDILDKHPEGITTGAIVLKANKMGYALKRGSVASLLSVMTKKGIILYNNGLYRLISEGNPKESSADQVESAGS